MMACSHNKALRTTAQLSVSKGFSKIQVRVTTATFSHIEAIVGCGDVGEPSSLGVPIKFVRPDTTENVSSWANSGVNVRMQ